MNDRVNEKIEWIIMIIIVTKINKKKDLVITKIISKDNKWDENKLEWRKKIKKKLQRTRKPSFRKYELFVFNNICIQYN